MSDEETAQKLISIFICEKDSDIENFLKERAIQFEKLGKNELCKDKIQGIEMMQYCLSTIFEGQSRLGGRIVMIECKNIPYLLVFYKKFGFEKVEKEYEKDELLQMIRIFQDDEIIEYTAFDSE